ncbi:phosphotransferase family protein [Paraburkholderia sp. BCC1884]|uniref:phosphotransferase family protein n=1 Tax=Paraburkholderia sp. BCC1884 TaxID=2562668 RepID=UPI00118312B0|nr:phosphotransferase family protein [Paraburkholderia sp. BCC1884]
MSDIPDQSGTVAVSPRNRFDEARLGAWMKQHVAGFDGPIEVEQFKGGQSNPTYRVRTPTGDYVLRRKPSGPLLKGAHAIEREARVVAALEPIDFPVPHVHGLCTDDSVIGSAFYVMDMVAGRIFWDASFSSAPIASRAQLMDAMNGTIAKLHLVDPVAIGLSDYGRVGGYIERQVARWSGQYQQDEQAGRNADMDRLAQWLPEHIPAADETSIVHGDFRVDNVIFHATEPRVIAVLDWELSTLGHPLADFAYHAMMFRMPSDILGGLAGVDLEAAGLPSEAGYVAAYCRRTGRTGIPDLDFYVAFNLFRFAAILHGIRGRVARGTAASADAQIMSARLERVAALAWQQAQSLHK